MDVNGSPEFALTWKTWDMPAGEPICALRASERRTGGKGCIGWPTPEAEEARRGFQNRNNGKKGTQKSPTTVAVETLAGWPTPMAGTPATETYNEAGNTDSSRKTVSLCAQAGQDAARSSAATAKPAAFRLNPRFSLWLMGYPAAWASCGERAMQSFQKSRRRS